MRPWPGCCTTAMRQMSAVLVPAFGAQPSEANDCCDCYDVLACYAAMADCARQPICCDSPWCMFGKMHHCTMDRIDVWPRWLGSCQVLHAEKACDETGGAVQQYLSTYSAAAASSKYIACLKRRHSTV